jgi:hypothetical protein
MKSYKLRNMPDSVHQMLLQKQADFQKQGKFVSLERVIYIMLKESEKQKRIPD